MKARQRDIWYAQLNPVKGSEQGGRRLVVVISGDTMSETLPIVIVCPLSGKVKGYPGCVLIRAGKETGLKQDSEVIVFQVRTLTSARLTKKMGAVSYVEFRTILQGLQEILTL